MSRDASASWPANVGHVEHVYVHFPFCVRKCPYCDFNSHAGRDEERDAYIEALIEEARRVGPLRKVRTLFLGGGTPTHATSDQLAALLQGIRGALEMPRLEEFSVEVNPGTLTAGKVRALCDGGVTRVSLGAQSFEDRHLKTLGRIHTAQDVRRSADLLTDAGVEHLSLDLIMAVPGQSLEEQERDVAQALALRPEHLSAYVLTIEAGTPFHGMVRDGRHPAPSGDRDLLHLHRVADLLEADGLARYEISNYARPGAQCRHNLAYWRDADWIGLGAGAFSHVGAERWSNESDPAEYVRLLRREPAALARRAVERSSPPTVLFEALMMGLRLLEGVDLDALVASTGLDARVEHARAIESHRAAGRVVLEGSRLRLTAAGLDVANRVLEDFLPG